MKKDLKTRFQNVDVPVRASFKQGLKMQLMDKAEARYEKPSFSWARVFRFAFAPVLLIVLLAVQVFPHNEDALRFIAEAKAYYDEHANEVHYRKFASEEGMIEVWQSPNGEEYRRIQMADGRIFQSLRKLDKYGNILIYDESSIVGKDALDYDAYLADLSDELMCIDREETSASVVLSWTRINALTGESNEGGSQVYPKDQNLQVYPQLEQAMNGHLPTKKLVDLIDSLKENPDMEYEKVEEEGQAYYVFRFDERNFSLPQLGVTWEDVSHHTVEVYFNAETYALEKQVSHEYLGDQLLSTMSFDLLEEEYYAVDDPAIADLFNNYGFALIDVLDWVDTSVEDQNPGCYLNKVRLSEQAEKLLKMVL